MESRDMMTDRGQTSSGAIESSEQNNAIELLNNLIAENRGLMQIYETAVSHLQTEANSELLQQYAAQHHNYIAELSNLVASYGGTPHTSGNATLKQIWLRLKSALSDGDGPILTEAAKAAENVLETYGNSMNEQMPDSVRDHVRHQLSEIRITVDKLTALDTAYNS